MRQQLQYRASTARLLLSSMESVVQKRMASTALVCPIRWALWIACISTAGFHHLQTQRQADTQSRTADIQTDGQIVGRGTHGRHSRVQQEYCTSSSPARWRTAVSAMESTHSSLQQWFALEHSPCDAHWRFSPSPPARRLRRMISTSGFVLKACSIALR
jgi:hypothetical protein